MIKKMCVATKYRYFKSNGKMLTEIAPEELMPNCKVSRKFVEQFNEDHAAIGVFYKIDEAKSEEFYAEFNSKQEARTQAEQLKEQVSEALVNTFKSVNEKVKKPKKEKDSE